MRLHFNTMRLCMRLLIRPLCFMILLVFATLMIWRVCVWVEQFKDEEVLQAHQLRHRSVSEIEHTAQMIAPLNASTANLARYLSSVLNRTALSFSTIQQKIAPSLFETLLTTPDVTDVAYDGFDGLGFAYFKDNRQTFARFSNSSESTITYTQPANRETGELFGEAALFNSTNKWNKTKGPFPYFQLEEGSNGVDLLFSNIFRMDGRGEVSIKFPVQKAIEQFNNLDLSGGLLHLAANGKVLMQTKLPEAEIFVDNTTLALKWRKENGDYDSPRKASCVSDNGNGKFSVKIRQNQHEFYCSTVKLAGIDSVYVLTFRVKARMEAAALARYTLAVLILVLVLLAIIFSLCLFTFLVLKAARREIVLCNALIKQKESTHQAERKSMSMSHAFATSSHDLRASLKVLTVLVEECHEDVVSKSRLKTNLTKINAYVQDLLGLLRNVLDQSKIEADKIELKDEEFNLTQVLEEVVERFYALGLRKGVDVLLDLSDGSVMKFSQVRGDKERLKQVLLNLLSNATKFTSEGHVVVRTTVRKRSEENAILAHNDTSILNRLSRLWCTKTSCSIRPGNNMPPFQQHPDCMEFIFDVDDTGCGIPKERRQSVFENYVQVKKHDPGQEGWGLGLGIVQSLVRMMGGEIKIVEKEREEIGTCFRFNVFLITSNVGIGDDENLWSYSGLHRVDGSHVVLLLHGRERRKISRTFLENLGIRVSVAKTGTELEHVLREPSLSEKLESGLQEGCSGTKDGHDSSSPQMKNPSFTLVVIDSAVNISSEASSFLSSFKENRGFQCKIVWWENRVSHNQIRIPPYDYILSKPLHGSVLHEMLGLLPEFHGAFRPDSFKLKQEAAEIEELDLPRRYIYSDRGNFSQELQEIVVHGKPEDEGPLKPLLGKTVLVVDDDPVLQRVTSAKLSQLGAHVDVCKNGKEAVDLVCQCLNDQENISSKDLPYDYIFMDCQMPILDGYEATRLIREEEKRHGIRMPIFALTCNSSDDDENTRRAGMDYHLSKPFKLDKLMEAIRIVKHIK